MLKIGWLAALVGLMVAVGCGGEKDSTDYPDQPGPSTDPDDDTPDPGTEPIPAVENWQHDLDQVALDLDMNALTGVALITTTSNADGVSLEVGGLAISRVMVDRQPVEYSVTGGRLDVGVAAGTSTIQVEYSFAGKTGFDGWMPDTGVTFLWPTFCGNLYPCISNPGDGFKLDVSLTNAPADVDIIFPESIAADAPSYMFGIAMGDYETAELGTTSAGTGVSVHYPMASEAESLAGTTNLVSVFDFFETTYGSYLFGDSVASVSANWGGGDYGGMEHHPYWHVSSGSMYSEEVHAHEAAHGWYGNGVRIECWEDFVLSEGTATYLAARSLAEQGVDLWPDYECGLKYVCEQANTVALPDGTCNEIDIINDPLWSGVPYMKGAYFFRSVSDVLGEDTVDVALAEFYADHGGDAARMQELIDHIKTKATAEQGLAIDTLVTDWLRTEACPVDTSALCPDDEG